MCLLASASPYHLHLFFPFYVCLSLRSPFLLFRYPLCTLCQHPSVCIFVSVPLSLSMSSLDPTILSHISPLCLSCCVPFFRVLSPTHPLSHYTADVNMPRMSGIQATERIRLFERTHGLPSVPIIGYTGSCDQQTVQQCLDASMKRVMLKPMRMHALQDLLKEHC